VRRVYDLIVPHDVRTPPDFPLILEDVLMGQHSMGTRIDASTGMINPIDDRHRSSSPNYWVCCHLFERREIIDGKRAFTRR